MAGSRTLRGAGRLLLAAALGLGLFLLLSGWLGHAASNQAVGQSHRVGVTLKSDPRVIVLLNQITTGTLVAHERALTGEEGVIVGEQLYTLTTRNSFSGEPISKATQYVYERFQSLGLDVSYHQYTHTPPASSDSYRWRNVVAERRGLRRPDEIYLITAHLDDMPTGQLAPGADDNASGSTAVLVAADLLTDLYFDCTLRFVLFTGEEQGLEGSTAYAADVAAAGDDVRGVINLDMIGYNSDAEPIVDLHARSYISDSVAIAEIFSQVVAAYNLDLVPDILVNNYLGNYSDNKSFWNEGYAAILAIEDFDDFTPYYHTSGDRLESLDLDYFREFVRAGVGTFAHMGCLASTELLTGTVTALDTGLSLSATVTAGASHFIVTTTTDPQGLYSLTLPLYTFTVQAQSIWERYQPAVVTNVIVLADVGAVQHFSLEPWPYSVFLPFLHK